MSNRLKKNHIDENTIDAPRAASISERRKNESYKRTLKRVQSELPILNRILSKIIHNKVIEKASDIAGGTIARPNSILFGAISAFIFSLITYYVAKRIGYQLSGSETIVAFMAGWIVGMLYDYLKLLFTGKK